MKKLLISAIAVMSVNALAVPHVFKSGEIATAKKFNENFASLEGGSTNSNGVGDPSNRWRRIPVNGVDMLVSTFSLGYYQIVTPTGYRMNVDMDGRIAYNTAYFPTDDCSGTGFASIGISIDTPHPNNLYRNANIGVVGAVFEFDGELFYSAKDEPYIVHRRSSRRTNEECKPDNRSFTMIAAPILRNDFTITGVHSTPFNINTVGEAVKIMGEVGTPDPVTP